MLSKQATLWDDTINKIWTEALNEDKTLEIHHQYEVK